MDAELRKTLRNAILYSAYGDKISDEDIDILSSDITIVIEKDTLLETKKLI